ncbi:MAG: hypothetical protein GSR78_04795 [Desulfurococcales archaeon]|nr:hypothetical protein [Desulfurococcales archaeon]
MRRYARVLAVVFLVGAVSGFFGFVAGVGYATGRAAVVDGSAAMMVVATGGLLAVFNALFFVILVRVTEFIREAWGVAERRRRARGAGG